MPPWRAAAALPGYAVPTHYLVSGSLDNEKPASILGRTGRCEMSVAEVRQIDGQTIAALNAHDIDAFLALCSDDIVWHDTGLPQPIRGKAGVRQYLQGWFTAFPDLRVSRNNEVAAEDSVAVELTFGGTHQGVLQGPPGSPPIPATGKRVTAAKGAYFFRVDHQKIVEYSAYPDRAGLMMQLGLMPSPGASPQR
jgi:steroid delta-isomerase-like uncharacterized protein